MIILGNRFSLLFLKKFLICFLSVFGAMSLVLEALDLFVPDAISVSFGYKGFFAFLIVSSLVSLYKTWPRSRVRVELENPDTCIDIQVGDIFDHNGNIVIGMNDVFDTELGEIINDRSIQGQLLTRKYNINRTLLDEHINSEIVRLGISGEVDLTKTRGKNIRYPIGTTLVIRHGNDYFFCCAYSRMGNDLRVSSNMDLIWHSLENLWVQIKTCGEIGRASCRERV